MSQLPGAKHALGLYPAPPRDRLVRPCPPCPVQEPRHTVGEHAVEGQTHPGQGVRGRQAPIPGGATVAVGPRAVPVGAAAAVLRHPELPAVEPGAFPPLRQPAAPARPPVRLLIKVTLPAPPLQRPLCL